MIFLITGVPGSGKTLKAVELIHAWLKQGRVVYSDIEGLSISGVLPSPEDWTTTPEGSVVIYDECQRIFPSTGKAGVADDPRIRAMETHRHTGHDLVFITQAPTFVHHHIRKLVGTHIHVYRPMGMKAATIYTWTGICDSPMDKREQKRADVTRWTYPEKLFSDYKSATVHTHKFTIPKKLIFIALALVAIVILIIYNAQQSSIFNPSQAAPESSQSYLIPAPVAPTQPPESGGGGGYNNPLLSSIHNAKPVTRSIIGCAMGRHCRVWGSDGQILDLSDADCRNICEGNLSMPLALPVAQAPVKEG